MQEHTPKIVRIAILLCLLLLSVVSPFLIREYEQRMAFQWEEMVQPHWESVVEQPLPVAQPVSKPEDVAEWKDISTEGLENMPVQKPETEKIIPVAIKKREKSVGSEKSVRPEKTIISEKKSSPKKIAALKLKVPDNLYQGKTAEWEEKPPVPLPDFFGPKQESPSRYQLGGRIIVDEEKKKQQPDAGYLDTVKGAEINISIKTP